MTLTSVTQSCSYSPHLGPVGCLPAPNIFPLAKETFAKGKMFWNFVFKTKIKIFEKIFGTRTTQLQLLCAGNNLNLNFSRKKSNQK